MTKEVFILGGAQTDFAVNWSRQGKEIGDLMLAAFQAGLDKTNISTSDIDAIHIGNFVGELFCHQGLLSGVLAEIMPSLDGIPSMRHEAACASGSMAALSAMSDIQAERYDLVAVLGVEYMRNVHGDVGAVHLASAAWHNHESQGIRYCWPHMFNQLTSEYEKRYGIDYSHIGAIAQKNINNARTNPNAQTRKWDFKEQSFQANDEFNPVIEGAIRRNDCGQITDGAAVIYLASEKKAQEYANQHNLSLDTIPRIKGWGHRASSISYQSKIEKSKKQEYVFPHVKGTIDDCFKRANTHLDSIDGIETHDCFAMTEYMAIDHFGITPPGQSWQAVEDGRLERNGSIPMNVSGGLIGLGHPVGATGVRMLLDSWKQIFNKAEDYQIEGAKNVATLNIGGSTTSIASFIVGI